MPQTYDFKRLRKTVIINRVVQFFFLALLVYTAFRFQAGLEAQGRPQRFLHSVIVTVVLQLILFYPLNRAGSGDANREVKASATGLAPEEQQTLRRARLFSDTIKGAIFLFFLTFIAMAPGDLFIQSTIFFLFIATILTYLQCFNFAANRGMRGQS